MYSQDPLVRDIIEDYLRKERNLETKIKECTDKRFEVKSHCVNDDCVGVKNPVIDSEDSRLRNQRFLKDIEEAKARLRTIASFTPTDQELRVLAGAYRGLLRNLVQSQQR